jgi:hypothetical protein
MKNISLILIIICMSIFSYGQAPQALNYQGIARDEAGHAMMNKTMQMRISIIDGAEDGKIIYVETHEVTTNKFGLYALQIGKGRPVEGMFEKIQWQLHNKYAKVEIDDNGLQLDLGTTQLLSVPYALYAESAGNANTLQGKTIDKITRTGAVSSATSHTVGSPDVNMISKFTAFNTIAKSQLFDNGSRIGYGTTTPLYNFHIEGFGEVNQLIKTKDSSFYSGFRIYNSLNKGFEFYQGGNGATGSWLGVPKKNHSFFITTSGVLSFSSFTDMIFGTAGTPRIFINSTSGNTGFGTSTPTAKLHVNGTVKITDGTQANNYILTSDAAGLASWKNPSTLIANAWQLSGNTPTATQFLGTTGPQPIIIKTNSVENARMLATGELGIGTTTPSAKLTVKSAKEAGLFTSNNINIVEVLSAEYNGTNGSDNVAVSGKSQPNNTSNTGIGVEGLGGLIGVKGTSTANDAAGINFGTTGEAINDGTATGMYASAQSNSSASVGDKSGVIAIAYSPNTNNGAQAIATGGVLNYGLTASASSAGNPTDIATGVYAIGEQTGVQGESYSIKTAQTENANIRGYVEGIGVLGKSFATLPAGNGASIGVAGSAIMQESNIDHFNVGLLGEANYSENNYGVIGVVNYTSTTATNIGIFGSAPVTSITDLVTPSFTPANSWAGYFDGDVKIDGSQIAYFTTAGTKAFMIDHPLDPKNKTLRHSAVESPDMMNIYNGNITTDANGKAIVTMPDYFEALNQEFRYQLTVIDALQFAQARITKKINGNQFEILTDKPNIEISWLVTGIRHDAVANKSRIVVEETKQGAMAGKYIWPQAFEDGKAQILEAKSKLAFGNTTTTSPRKEETKPATAAQLKAKQIIMIQKLNKQTKSVKKSNP